MGGRMEGRGDKGEGEKRGRGRKYKLLKGVA
jgi:hypothetical protein